MTLSIQNDNQQSNVSLPRKPRITLNIISLLEQFNENCFYRRCVISNPEQEANWLSGALDKMIDFNGMSTHLGLFYAHKFGNYVYCTFIFTFFV